MTSIHSNPATPLPDATRLAIDRTRLAHERTLMAWVRTATSLISFGFTIYKFFQYLNDSAKQSMPDRLIGPTEYAQMMILLGVVGLAAATVDHYRSLKALERDYGAQPRSNALWLGGIITLIGVAGLFMVFFRQ